VASSQKFIARNRAPRVQIEYDVELYGAEKKIQLPFVMGVMSDLSGKSEVKQPSVKDRKFLEIDIDNFDSRMKSMKPRAAFSVANTLTGEGNLSVDLTFEKMSDFSPAAIASKIEPLRKLLEARTQLSNLLTYMDGKAGAEELIEQLMEDPEKFKSMALAGAAEAIDTDAAFDAIKAATPEVDEIVGDNSGILDALKADAPDEGIKADDTGDILAGMAENQPEEEAKDKSGDILAGMAADAPEDTVEDDGSDAALSAMRDVEVDEEPEEDSSDLPAEMAADAPDEPDETDDSKDILAGMAADAPEQSEEVDQSADILADMSVEIDEEPEEDNSGAALDAMRAIEVEEKPVENNDDLLADMAANAPEEEPEGDDSGDILAAIADDQQADIPQDNTIDTALDAMREVEIDEEVENNNDDLLADLAAGAPDDEPKDDGSDILADLASDLSEDEPEEDQSGAALDAMRATEIEDVAEESNDDLLAEMAADAPEEEVEQDALADIEFDVPDEIKEDAGTDILAELAEAAPQEEPEDQSEDILADLTFEAVEEEPEENSDDILAGLELEEEPTDVDKSDDILADLAEAAPENVEDDSNDILADLALDIDGDEEVDSSDDILADLAEETSDEDDLDALLASVLDDAAPAAETDTIDDLLGDLGLDLEEAENAGDADPDDDLAALLAEPTADQPEGVTDDLSDDDDLDALLAENTDTDDVDDLDLDDLLSESDDDLDALLADDLDDDLTDLLGGEDDDDLAGLLDDEVDVDDIDALLSEDGDDDLDDLLGDLGDEPSETEEAPVTKPKKPAFQPNFGSMTAAKVQDEAGSRRKFCIAVLGDFSGRGNRGDLETGADLAKRKGFKLDFDTMEDVITRFRTTLTLPLGNDGTAVEVELNELDDLHPDELFEKVEMFNELSMLRRDLVSGRNLDAAIVKMQGWGDEFGDFRAKSNKRAKGSAAPADLRLTDFQNLIGDSTPTLEASEASDLISRIVGPHIVAAKDKGSEEMIAAVDAALSTAMSSVLHHPDFQTVEAGWRAIELLGRRIEASASLEVVVYDMSVEEFAADLAGVEDMAETGLYDMLVEKPRMDESGGPFAAVFGLYTWEETPPHAEILARMARICANMDAPFVSAMSTAFMGVKPEDRHKLVQDTWGALREMPEAKYLGLATPRFLLRMPYGKKTEPVDRFDYEEFNLKDGMRSMLFANPATLVAVLLGETLARQGKDMSLGSILSLDDMPFHYMTDQYGDQVALPCTERLLNVRSSADVIARGYMPVISVQGQNMVKLGSFQAVGGGELLGIWSGDGAKQLSSGSVRMKTSVGFAAGAEKPAPAAVAPAAGGDLDLGDDDDFDLGGDDDLDLDIGGDDDLDLGGDDDLDDLLSGFGDDDDLGLDDDDDMDDDLAALLGDL